MKKVIDHSPRIAAALAQYQLLVGKRRRRDRRLSGQRMIGVTDRYDLIAIKQFGRDTGVYHGQRDKRDIDVTMADLFDERLTRPDTYAHLRIGKTLFQLAEDRWKLSGSKLGRRRADT